MKVTLLNDIHPQKEIKILKLATADAKVGNDGTNNIGIFSNKRTHARALPKSTRLE